MGIRTIPLFSVTFFAPRSGGRPSKQAMCLGSPCGHPDEPSTVRHCSARTAKNIYKLNTESQQSVLVQRKTSLIEPTCDFSCEADGFLRSLLVGRIDLTYDFWVPSLIPFDVALFQNGVQLLNNPYSRNWTGEDSA